MWFINVILLILFVASDSEALYCYNGTFSYKKYGEDPITYRGLSGPSHSALARIHCSLTIPCLGEHAMCFVRAWRARSRYTWIVQRGCYHGIEKDPLLISLNKRTLTMRCTKKRLADAEYTVCLCQSDWCNTASRHKSYAFLILSSVGAMLACAGLL